MKCFEKNNVPPGYTPVEGSKCSATEEECAKECGPCWRCYGKSQGECCETIMQRSGYKFCNWLTENSPVVGDLYPNARVSTDGDSFSGLFFRSVDPAGIQLSSTPPADNQPKVFARGSVDSEQNNECEFATLQVSCSHELETSGPVFEQREQTNAFINTRTVGSNLDYPAVLLGAGSQSSSSNVKGRITSASFGGVSVTVPDGKSQVVFYPSYGNIPPVTDPTQFFVPVDSYAGTISYDWFFVNNKTGTNYSGSVSIEWDELICKDFCVSQEDPEAIVEYQCFDAPPDEDGWTPVGDCHATEEECAKECGCWRCYEPCDGLVVEIEVIGLEGDLGDRYNAVYIDDTAETGIPIGTILRPWRSRVQDSTGDTFLDYAYASPNASRPPNIYGPAGSTVFGGAMRCSKNNLLWYVGDKTGEAPGVPPVNFGNQFNLLRGGSPFGTGFSYDPILSIPKEQLENNGTYTFSHAVMLYTEFDGAPVVARIDLLARVMNPEDAKKNTTQCFLPKGAPDGWSPVGDCHKTQAECEAACGTTRRSRTMPTTTTGPGTHLAKTLAAWGIKGEKGCKCKSMERTMNKWGSACAKDPHLTTIVDHLEKEAKKRGLPFVRKLGEMLVKRAVRQSEESS